jgi:hypothetical protein
MDEEQLKIYDALKNLGSEEMLDIILDYHGTQLLSSGFKEHLIDEGVLEGPEEVEDDEEEEKTIQEIVESLGWNFELGNQAMTFQKHSPSGEDFSFTIEVIYSDVLEEVKTKVREYADDFDPDEHAAFLISIRGQYGVPSSTEILINDAKAIKEMLEELAEGLEEKNEE